MGGCLDLVIKDWFLLLAPKGPGVRRGSGLWCIVQTSYVLVIVRSWNRRTSPSREIHCNSFSKKLRSRTQISWFTEPGFYSSTSPFACRATCNTQNLLLLGLLLLCASVVIHNSRVCWSSMCDCISCVTQRTDAFISLSGINYEASQQVVRSCGNTVFADYTAELWSTSLNTVCVHLSRLCDRLFCEGATHRNLESRCPRVWRTRTLSATSLCTNCWTSAISSGKSRLGETTRRRHSGRHWDLLPMLEIRICKCWVKNSIYILYKVHCSPTRCCCNVHVQELVDLNTTWHPVREENMRIPTGLWGFNSSRSRNYEPVWRLHACGVCLPRRSYFLFLQIQVESGVAPHGLHCVRQGPSGSEKSPKVSFIRSVIFMVSTQLCCFRSASDPLSTHAPRSTVQTQIHYELAVLLFCWPHLWHRWRWIIWLWLEASCPCQVSHMRTKRQRMNVWQSWTK